MSEQWGPWIEHDGKGCPCLGQWVKAVFHNGNVWEGIAGSSQGAENLGTGPVEVLTPASSATESASPAPFKTSSNWLRNFQRG